MRKLLTDIRSQRSIRQVHLHERSFALHPSDGCCPSRRPQRKPMDLPLHLEVTAMDSSAVSVVPGTKALPR